MKIVLFIHGSREKAFDAGEKAGLAGKALQMFSYTSNEHRIEYLVDEKTGVAIPITIDGREIKP
jgi:ribosome modulation factor